MPKKEIMSSDDSEDSDTDFTDSDWRSLDLNLYDWILNVSCKNKKNIKRSGLTENLFMMCDVIIDIFIWLDVSSFFEYDWFHSWLHSVFWFIFSDCASQFFRIILQLRKVLFTFSIVCLQWTSLDGAVGLKLIFSTLKPAIVPRVRQSFSWLQRKGVYLLWKTWKIRIKILPRNENK